MQGRHSTWTCSAYVFLELLKFWDVSMSHQDTQALELVERVARENYNSSKVDAHRWVLTRMDNGKASMAHAKIGWSFTTCWFHLFNCFVFVECREDSWSLSKVVELHSCLFIILKHKFHHMWWIMKNKRWWYPNASLNVKSIHLKLVLYPSSLHRSLAPGFGSGCLCTLETQRLPWSRQMVPGALIASLMASPRVAECC